MTNIKTMQNDENCVIIKLYCHAFKVTNKHFKFFSKELQNNV